MTLELGDLMAVTIVQIMAIMLVMAMVVAMVVVMLVGLALVVGMVVGGMVTTLGLVVTLISLIRQHCHHHLDPTNTVRGSLHAPI